MNNNFNRFTLKAQEAVEKAQELVLKFNHNELKPAHLLRSLISDDQTLIRPMLLKTNIDLQKMEKELDRYLENLPQVFVRDQMGQLYLSQEIIKVFNRAATISMKRGDEFVSCEHLLLALVLEPSTAKEILERFGANKDSLMKSLVNLRGSTRVTDDMPENKFRAIERYTVDLTEMAENGDLDPVIGREEELRRVMQVLTRRTKNNPALIGEPGVGKTAIVEGLAQKIVSGEVPESLKGKKLVSLDMGSLIAGTKFRGEFEDRLRSLIKEINDAEGDIIVFIDEIHMIVGAGAAEGAMDAANLLKPALARGELHAIGATTLKEYRQHIEKDAALERRFQPVIVEEPTIQDSVAILRGLREKYEMHHGLKISDDAIVSAVNLSARYITDRFLPDKAVDLIDEAAAMRSIESDSLPSQLEEVRQNIKRLEIEKQALQKDIENRKTKKTEDRLKEVEKELKALKQENDKVSAQWHNEKIAIEDLHELRKKIDDLRWEAEVAEREGDFESVAQIRYGDLPDAEKDVEKFEKKIARKNKGKGAARFIKEHVDAEDIATVVSRWTGIPVQRMLESEMKKLARIEKDLDKRVIGQEHAIESISRALRRSRTGLSDENRPVGSFMFLGPTGVGKTELARALAEFMFNDEKAMVRVDMSEYMERHAVSKLIGSPPGYVGHDEGGRLTDIVRHRPYSLILFDEIEKAHPEVFSLLLQVLDEGRLTDSKGKTANFRNTIIIMTSNVGSQYFKDVSSMGFNVSEKDDADNVEEEFRTKVLEDLRSTFKPEFLNRLDETIIFNSLKKKDIRKIVDIQLAQVEKRLEEKDIKIKVNKKVKDYLAENGFDPDYGARPLKRLIQKLIIDELADNLVHGKIKDGKTVKVSLDKKNKVAVTV